MYDHPSYIFDTIKADQERLDRANELHRSIIEHPERVVPRPSRIAGTLRGWFRAARRDAAASAAAVCEACGVDGEVAARPAPAR
ncbi:hypothetical protein HD600_001447 [Microbacterium ginsengiterrae]|uniref:Uncharacterized protein n=1 Tax=Microbacterium ginsengiterrae TaxID=546115 RepID=A0A7W9CCA5_9MICO|nr:hypothetical protein [Microbacterium ginsengiterrae]MBB5742950.1 hypothetical protein [Microbacterium ginsengiterrae]